MGLLSLLFGNKKESAAETAQKNQKKFEIFKYDGMRAWRMGHLDYAIKCFNEAWALENDFETMGYLAQTYQQTNQLEAARGLYNLMHEMEPEHIITLINLANVCHMQEDYPAMEKAAKKGDARAQFETGNSYYTGNVVTKNDNTAAEWYMKAMLQGHEAATEKFYSFYSKDLEKRAKGGDARAQFETGNYYFTGLGVKTDHETAAEWYEIAMKQGHEDAKVKFYAFYSKILEKAAKNGDAEAQFQVGNFYFTGATGKKDIETAAEWYEKGMSQGHEGAKEKYYSYYSKTLEKNSKKDIEALYRIGCFYMDGGSVEKDMKKAIKLLLKADKDGHPEAFNKFGSVFNKELQKMAKKGDVRAKLAIAKCYLNGSGITKNPKRAAEFLEEIADDFEVGEEAKALLQSIENE